MSDRLTAIVPTWGAPSLPRALAALLADPAIGRLRAVVPAAAARRLEAIPRDPRLEILPTAAPLGFAAAVGHGFEGLATPWVAVVNDDAFIGPGWGAALLAALEAEPGAAAAQGIQSDGDGALVDGAGIAWNADWQAVQALHGEPIERAPEAAAGPREIFGASGTAAIWRRAALDDLRANDGFVLDERLDSWYEDVDLAARLRARGGSALLVPAARARHLGSATGRRRPMRRWRLVHANRRLVLRRLLGRAYARVRPVVVRRDRRDFAAALARGEVARAAGILLAPLRERRLRTAFAHDGEPLVAPAVLRRFGAPALAIGSSADLPAGAR